MIKEMSEFHSIKAVACTLQIKSLPFLPSLHLLKRLNLMKVLVRLHIFLIFLPEMNMSVKYASGP